MAQTFKVTISGELNEREVAKVSKALHKAMAKWFKDGHAVTVEP